jgi:DNA replication and repair protein RecF
MITKIALQHFRSYNAAEFEFGPSVNIIVGPNTAGKTNLLEAVLVMARGGSYRAHDAELIAFDAPWARIDAELDEQKRTVKLQKAGDRVVKSFDIDGQVVSRLHHSRTLPVVLFEPNHLLRLSSVPDQRRAFLDDLIEQIEPSFSVVRRQFKRVLAQRNALLKRNPPDLVQQLFVWDIRLSELAGKMVRSRLALIAACNEQLSAIYDGIASADANVTLEYQTSLVGDYETALLRKLEQHVDIDVMRGYTIYGPHRDDMLVLLNRHPLQDAASRGEVRSVVLALKIVELQLIEQAREARPILLLDDVFSELDSERRKALTGYVGQYQAFITTTEADDVAKSFQRRKIVRLKSLR